MDCFCFLKSFSHHLVVRNCSLTLDQKPDSINSFEGRIAKKAGIQRSWRFSCFFFQFFEAAHLMPTPSAVFFGPFIEQQSKKNSSKWIKAQNFEENKFSVFFSKSQKIKNCGLSLICRASFNVYCSSSNPPWKLPKARHDLRIIIPDRIFSARKKW